MSSRRSEPVRGLMPAKSLPLFQGRFGRMFRSLPPAKFGESEEDNIANLAQLAKAMTAQFEKPKDGKDDEERFGAYLNPRMHSNRLCSSLATNPWSFKGHLNPAKKECCDAVSLMNRATSSLPKPATALTSKARHKTL
jgi:hypothetical protein